MANVSNVLIVGGGIAGMTLATGLRRRGIAAEIVEISPDWTVLGLGIALQGPTLRALATIGVLDDCVREGFPISRLSIGGVDSKITSVIELPRLNGPAYPATIGIMRPALHAVLARALRAADVPVRLGLTVASLEQRADAVEAAFTDGSRGRYDLVVGADGIHSTVRELAFGPGPRPAYTGQAVWRATVPRAPEVDSLCMFYGPRNKAGFNPVSQREMYIFLVENAPEYVRRPDARLAEALREQLADFRGLMAEAREQVRRPEQIVCRPVESFIAPPPWHRGRVVLVGDAIHPTTPHLASGAGIAIEDTIVLAELLASETPLADALDRFAARRYERCRMVVENSIQLGEWEKTPTAPEADPVGLSTRSLAALAQPI
jgi:2-polyprenyl-6-methoxyphenol hydroxylase-like FAD-dependent oxidoreductase